MQEVPFDASDPSEPADDDACDELGLPADLGEIYDVETLAALDAWADRIAADTGTRPPLPSRLTSWSRRTTMGLVMQGMVLGLQEVFEPSDKETIVVEVDADGLPHDLPVQLLLDPDDPRGSLALVRRDPTKPPAV